MCDFKTSFTKIKNRSTKFIKRIKILIMTVKLSNKYFFKYSILFILLFCSFINTVNAQKNLGIGTDKPDPKAVLELNVENPSINPQGLLLPRLTDAQGTLLGSMLNTSHKGMSAYNTTNNTFYIWDGTQWKSTGSVLTSIIGLGGIVISTSGNSFTVDGNNLKSQWISASSNQIYTNSFVGIGTNNPNGLLQFPNTDNNRKIVLHEDANNDFQFYGLGIGTGHLRYSVGSVGGSHRFFAATSSATAVELMRIQGDGNVGIGTLTPNEKLTVQGNSSVSGIGYMKQLDIFNNSGNQVSFIRSNASGQSSNIFEFATGRYNNNANRTNSQWQVGLVQETTASDGDGFIIGRNNIGVDFIVNRQGNTGIGGILPNEKLTVQGNSSVTGIGYFSTISGLALNGASAGSIVTVDGVGKLGFGTLTIPQSQWLTTTAGIYYGTSVGIGMLPIAGNSLNVKSAGNSTKPIRVEYSGTTFPIFEVDQGSGGQGNLMMYDNAGVKFLQLGVNNNAYFNGAGNFGIGTINPNEKLTVQGNSSVTGVGYFSSISGLALNGAPAGSIVTVDGVGRLGFGNVLTSSQWITTTSGIYTTSNVGIGFAGNPTQGKFVVVEDAANNPGIFVSGGGPLKSVNIQLGRNNSPDGGIGIAGAVGSFSGIAVAGDMVVRSEFNHLILSAKNAGGDIKFATGATDTEKMRITNLGNVGIGIVNPSAKLDIKDVDVSNSAYDGVRFDLAQGGNSGLKNGLLLNYSVSGTVSATNRGITTNVVGTSSASGGVTGNVINMNVSGTGTVNGLAVSVPSNSTGNKTGAFIQVSGTGGSQNIGLNVNVLGATTNYAAILNGGNVGIGTSTPNQQLAVVGNSSVSGIGYFGTLIGNNLSGASGSVVTVDGTGKLGIGTLVQGNNYWEPNGTNKIYTNSFVGIGESNPLVPLSIKSTDSNLPSVLKITRDVTTGTGAQIGIDVAFTGSQVSGSKIGYNVKVTNPANESVRGMSSEIEQNNTTATGVLIASYSYINNNGPTQSLAFRAENGGSGVGNHMGFSAFDNSTGNGERFGLHSEMIGTGAAANNYAIYGKATGAGLNNYAGYFADGKVYIENNVGIGTTNPTAKLDIIGTLRFRNFTNGILTVDGTGLIGVGTMPSASNWLSTTVGVTFTNDKIAIGTSTVAGAARFKVAGDGSMGGMVITSQSLVNPISTSNTVYTTLITVPVYIPQGTNTIEFNVIGSSQGGGNIDFQLDVSGNTSAPISMTNTTPTIGTTPQTVSVASVNGWQTIKINVANSAGNTSAILHGYTVIVKN